MASGWRYRVASVGGAVGITVLALAVANTGFVQSVYSLFPVVGHLPFETEWRGSFALEAATTVVVVVGALVPLYKPRPRRPVDVAVTAVKRTFVACIGLAAIGYFNYTYRLPRATLIVAAAVMTVAFPAYFITIRRRARTGGGRTIVVGDDPAAMDDILSAVDGEILGFVSPPRTPVPNRGSRRGVAEYADGGTRMAPEELPCLGGLSRLEDVIVEHDVDTAVFAFGTTDRAEFFGALGICHDHGVAAKIHRDRADSVLIASGSGGEVVDVDLEPWDWQDRALKRAFDVAFASVGLLLAVPAILVIATAIKLEDGDSVFYSQDRTAELGETFTVYKFRSMTPDDEDERPGEDESRITRVGRVIRRTHLDEIPQLWSILMGDMSVVGPRAVWVDEEPHLEREVGEWQQRWFVKPGLTGLAQINDAGSERPHHKLRYDLEYIRRQSFRFDVAIVVRQVWMVVVDVIRTVFSTN